ncbi:MAG TPA: hypothetical protein VLA13_04215, partial [Massilibacterium sp.]|nr:hypothetical protein [Massilibacterium sp.]
LQQARAEIDQTQQNWKTSIEDEKEVFLEELHLRTSRTVIELLDKLIRELADRSLEEQAVQKFIHQLQTMDKKEQKRALRSALEQGEGELIVRSSFPLSDEQKKGVRQAIENAFSVSVNCSFAVSSLLGFGIEIRTNGWRMGWNARIYLDELERKMGDLFDTEVEVSHS